MNVSLSETGKNLAAKKWRLETTKAPALQVSGVALPDPSLSPRIYLQRLEQALVAARLSQEGHIAVRWKNSAGKRAEP
jgi:hypothetical protein